MALLSVTICACIRDKMMKNISHSGASSPIAPIRCAISDKNTQEKKNEIHSVKLWKRGKSYKIITLKSNKWLVLSNEILRIKKTSDNFKIFVKTMFLYILRV